MKQNKLRNDLVGAQPEPAKLKSVSHRSVEQIRGEARMRRGNTLIISGFVVAVVGIVFYCVACFAGGMNQELGAILLDNVVPFARTALAVIGLGTGLWLVGSMMYLMGAMDTDFKGEPKL